MKDISTSQAISVVVAVLIAVIIVLAILTGQTAYQEWHEDSREWCDEQNGELTEEMAGGGMSGLKCTLPSGKAVDMGEVEQRGYPEDPSDVPAYGTAEYDGAYTGIWKVGAVSAVLAIILYTGLGMYSKFFDVNEEEDKQ